ncbi:MAG: class I SAM-dependent methyltransferase [Candidatus Acidiferrales bacterium]
MKSKKANYGLDAPGVVRALLIGGAAGVVAGYFVLRWAGGAQIEWAANLAQIVLNSGVGCLIGAAMMFASSYYGKFRVRDHLLDLLKLRGDETVLDVGCGHGLLLIGAAKRLPRGRAFGIDLWSQVDQSNNSREATLRNAEIKGVAERVEIRDGDMRKLPFADASFDAAVASLAIHNVPSHEGRRKTIREIVRVLKPGGQVALMDIKSVGLYADELRKAGMSGVRVAGPNFWIWPPVRIVTAKKSAAIV